MRKVTLLVLAVIIICPALIACTGLPRPTVGTVPDGWHRTEQISYGTIEEADGTKWGLIQYTDEVDYDFVQIFWGDIPAALVGNESDGATLIEYAVLWSTTFDPTETGTMTISGHMAGYSRAYDATYDVYDMEIVFVIDSTCIDIYTCFDANASDEAQAMSLINSIH